MNNIKSRMLSDKKLRVAYGAVSRAQAFKIAAKLAKERDQQDLSQLLTTFMQIWSRFAAEEIKANVK